MPWQEFLTVDERRIIQHPNARPHHLSPGRTRELLDSVAMFIFISLNPHLKDQIHGAWHLMKKPDSPLHGFYTLTHDYISRAITALNHTNADGDEHLRDWLERHTNELGRRIDSGQ